MFRRLAGIALVMLAMFGVTGGLATPASAAVGNCSVVVVDDANVFGGEIGRVEDAADELRHTGADVYVRTITSYAPDTKIRDYVLRLVGQCPAWQDDFGGTKANLLVLVLSTSDRDVIVAGGDRWKPALEADNQDQRIQGEVMIPYFEGGDYAGGFIAGMQETGKVIKGGNGVDLSGLWSVLKWLLLIIAVVIAVVIFLVVHNKAKKEKTANKAAQVAALNARNATSNMLSDAHDRLPVIEAKVAQYEGFEEPRIAQMRELLVTAKSNIDNAQVGMANARKAHGQPDDAGLPTVTYQAMVAAYEETKAQAKTARDAVQAIDDLSAQITAALASLPRTITSVRQEIDMCTEVHVPAAKAALDRICAEFADASTSSVEGNGTEADKRIAAATQALNQAQAFDLTDRHQQFAALAALAEADEILAKAISLLRSITQREKHLLAAKAQAPTEITAAKADIDKAATYIAEHDDVTGGFEDDLAEARRQLAEAEDAYGQPQPDYERVVELATAANTAADRILEGATDIVRLQQRAASALQQARAATSKAAEYIADHDDVVGSTAEHYLQSAQENLNRAYSTGNLQTILDAATKAKRDADTAYREARDDFDDARRDDEDSGFGIGVGTGYVIGSSTSHRPGGGFGGGNWGGRPGGLSGSGSHFGGSRAGGLSGSGSKW